METTKLNHYVNMVNEAAEKVSAARAGLTVDEVTLVVVKAAHGDVRKAHKCLKKACRTYRRRIWVSRFILWGEYEAVSMGYLRFEDVDRTP